MSHDVTSCKLLPQAFFSKLGQILYTLSPTVRAATREGARLPTGLHRVKWVDSFPVIEPISATCKDSWREKLTLTVDIITKKVDKIKQIK